MSGSPSPGPQRASDDQGARDPDYRFTLANERTFLAWVRTSLALVAGGVAIVQLAPGFGFGAARQLLGVALTALGVAVSAGSLLRWRRVQTAMERNDDLPPNRMPMMLGTALVVVGVLVGVLLLLPGPA